MRWLFKEPSVWAVVFASAASIATFLYGRAGVSAMFQNFHLWCPAYAEIAGILSLVFAFLALVALVCFFVTLHKKRRKEVISSEMESSDIRDIKESIEAIRKSQELLVNNLFDGKKGKGNE